MAWVSYAKMEEGGGLVDIYKDKVETFFIVFVQAQQFCNLIPTLSPCPNENMNGEGREPGNEATEAKHSWSIAHAKV